MTVVMEKVTWYIKMISAYARASFLSQLMYPLNFFSGFFTEIACLSFKLIYLVVVIQAQVSVGGFTSSQVMIFIGIYIFMTGIWGMLGWLPIPRNVRSGNLDLQLIKPGATMFQLTFSNFNYGGMIPNVVAGIILICFGWSGSDISITLLSIIGFIFFMIVSIVLTYAISIIPQMLVFWLTSVDGVTSLLPALWDFNNMPMTIYSNAVRQVGTFIIPIFLLTNWPGLFILKMLSPVQFLWGIAAPIILVWLSHIVLQRGLRKYTSANG